MGLPEPNTPKSLQLAFVKQKYPSLENHTLCFPSKTVHLQVHWDSMTIQRITHFFQPSVGCGVSLLLFPQVFSGTLLLEMLFYKEHSLDIFMPVSDGCERHVNLTRVQHGLLFLNLEYFILGSFTTLKHNES